MSITLSKELRDERRTKMSEYELQGEDFLEQVVATITWRYLGRRKHFPNDTADRDCYEYTIERGGRKYTSTFGDSIERTNRDGCYIVKKKGNVYYINQHEYHSRGSDGQRMGVYRRKEPSAYSLLACLTKYDPGSFKDFCSDFGYSTDSISAHKTFLAVDEEWHAVNRMFGDIIDELQEIQ
jgi:ribosomal protein L36